MVHRCGPLLSINFNFVKWNSCGAHLCFHLPGKFEIFRRFMFICFCPNQFRPRGGKSVFGTRVGRPYFIGMCKQMFFFSYIFFAFTIHSCSNPTIKTRNSHKINVSFVQRNHALNHRNTHPHRNTKKKWSCIHSRLELSYIHYSKLASSIWSRQFSVTLAACAICLVMPISKAQLNDESNANIP